MWPTRAAHGTAMRGEAEDATGEGTERAAT